MKQLTVIARATPKGTLNLSADQRAQVHAFLAAHKDRDVSLALTCLTGRTAAQRAYYWGVAIPFISRKLRELGHEEATDSYTNTLLKLKFNATDFVDSTTGEVISNVPQSFEAEPPEVFSQILDRINAWCVEWIGETPPAPSYQTTT